VTTVRDLGDRGGLAMRLRDRIAARELTGPRIVASGPPLTIASAVEAGVATVEHCTWMREGGFDRRDNVAKDMAERGIYVCCAMSRRWRVFLDRLGPERAAQTTERIRWMDELGVRLIPGTDAGLPGSGFDDFAGALGFQAYLGFSPAPER
jgi:imidazolonepropionase-like amidohydrolase